MLLASCCLAGQIRVWDAQTGDCLTVIPKKGWGDGNICSLQMLWFALLVRFSTLQPQDVLLSSRVSVKPAETQS